MNWLLTVPHESFFTTIEETLVDILSKNRKNKVFYISLNKSYSYLKNSLTSKKIDFNRIFIMDCATKAFHPNAPAVKDCKNCYFINAVDLINKLDEVKVKFLDTGNYNCVIFDSLSSFLVYYPQRDVIKYLMRFSNSMALDNINIYYICTDVYLIDFEKQFSKKGILEVQDKEGISVLKFQVEKIIDYINQIRDSFNRGDKDFALKLYNNIMVLYGKLGDEQINSTDKKKIYNLAIKWYEELKKL